MKAEFNGRIKAAMTKDYYNKYERAAIQFLAENAGYYATGELNCTEEEWSARAEKMQKLLDEHGDKIDFESCAPVAKELALAYKELHQLWNRERVRDTVKTVGEIEWYVPHFQEEATPATFWGVVGDWFNVDTDSENLKTKDNGTTAYRNPKSRFNAHAGERQGDTSTWDAFKGFDNYLDGVLENITMTECSMKLRALEQTLRSAFSEDGVEERLQEIMADPLLDEETKQEKIDGLWQGNSVYGAVNFVGWLHNYANIVTGKKSFADRNIEATMGRDVYVISKAIEGRIAANMVGRNIGSAMTNFVPIFQLAGTERPDHLIKAIYQTLDGYRKAAFYGEDEFWKSSDFLVNRRGANTLMQDNYKFGKGEGLKRWVQNASDKSMGLMTHIDDFVSEVTVRTYLNKAESNGYSYVDAMGSANDSAARMMGDRSEGALPGIFNDKNPITKLVTVFQVENWNQYPFFFEDIIKSNWNNKKFFSKENTATVMKVCGYLIASRLVNFLMGALFGRDDVVPDPIQTVEGIVKDVNSGENVGDVLWGASKDALQDIPFVGSFLGGGRIPYTSAFPDFEGFYNDIKSSEDIGDVIGAGIDNLADPLGYILSPTGYGQARKTFQGGLSLIQGEMTGQSGDDEYVKFIQDDDPLNIFKALINGPYATDAGQEYIDSGFKRLSVDETRKMESAKSYGIDEELFYDVVLGLKKYSSNGEKRIALYSMDEENLDEREKDILDSILFGGAAFERGIETMNGNDFTEEEITTIGETLKGKGSKREKRNAIMGLSGFTPEEKAYIEKMYGSDITADYSSEEAFRVSNLSDRELRLEGMGLSPEDTQKVETIFAPVYGYDADEKRKEISKRLGVSASEAEKIYSVAINSTWYEHIDELDEEERTRFDLAAKWEGMDERTYVTVQNYGDNYALLGEALGCSENEAKEIYKVANSYKYSTDDLDADGLVKYEKVMSNNFNLDDEIYFTVLNHDKAGSEKDSYGNSLDGTNEDNSIKAIAEALGCTYEEAKLYYYEVNKFDYDRDDLSTTLQEVRYEDALLNGWSSEKYFYAKNAVSLAGASDGTKAEKINALLNAGFTNSEAMFYYELQKKNSKSYAGWKGLPEDFEETPDDREYSFGSEGITETETKEDFTGKIVEENVRPDGFEDIFDYLFEIRSLDTSDYFGNSGIERKNSIKNRGFERVGYNDTAKRTETPTQKPGVTKPHAGKEPLAPKPKEEPEKDVLDEFVEEVFGSGGSSTEKPKTEYFKSSLSTEEQGWQEQSEEYGWTSTDFEKALSIVKSIGGKNARKDKVLRALLAEGFDGYEANGFFNLMHGNPYYLI